jgi:hypothetical protein
MTTILVLETLAILLLAILVAGLLRSHAEILRRLHDLGVGYGDEAPARAPGALAARAPHGHAPPITGTSPGGDAVAVDVGRGGERTLVLFLSSGCATCRSFWDALRAQRHTELQATRTVVVARDATEDSPARLAELAPTGLTIVLSSRAWDAFGVPGSPYAVLVGDDGTIAGAGSAAGWDQLRSLLSQAAGDALEARADRELQAAGIHPGHPSLHPPVSQPR